MKKVNQFLTIPVVLFFLHGCDSPQNFMHGAGPAARNLASLGWLVLLLFSLVTVVMTYLILWVATRRKGSFEEHASVNQDSGQHWILIGGVAIPVTILAVVFISSIQSIQKFPLDPGSDAPADIHLTGRQWWFNAQYPRTDGNGYISSPTEIHVPTETSVDIALDSLDVIHSFWVPKLHGKVDLVPGQTNHIRIKVDEPGTYVGECGEFCGLQHAHMRVQVIAHSSEGYREWLEAQQKDAHIPISADARMGQQVFMDAACTLCHTIRGTEAHGNIGPDLTHVGSRTRIAGGMLANNTANLSAWITQAQSLKPGTKMPDIKDFTGEELQALVAYLQSLE